MHFLLQRMHKATNALHCLGDHCIRRGVGQAHKAGRAEGRAGHDSHKAVRKQKLGEGQIVLPSSDFPMAERISNSR